MVASPDNRLLAIGGQYVFPAAWDGTVAYDEIRKKTRELRQVLKGKFSNSVTISEEEWGRRFVPMAKAGAKRVIVYIHGGGWCNCDPFTHGSVMTDLAGLSGLEVYGVRYPLSPEHAYPAALDVICTQVERIRKETGCELVLGGDSAGANLALAVALRLRDEGKAGSLCALLLWYGCYRAVFDTRSHLAYGDGSCGLTTQGMKLFWQHYLGDMNPKLYADLTDADMTGLPASYLCEAECDCLADDSRWLAGRLIEAGVEHHYDVYAGATHGFIHYSECYEASLVSLTKAARFALDS